MKEERFILEIANSHIKLDGSKFHMWNFSIPIMYFTYEVEDSHVKIHYMGNYHFTSGMETFSLMKYYFPM